MTARSLPGVVGYGSISRGYKAGGFNIDGTLPANLREYEPEVLWNFETGVKARTEDGRLSIRGSVFHMQRDDVQIDSSIVIFQEDGSTEFIDFRRQCGPGHEQRRRSRRRVHADGRGLACTRASACCGQSTRTT